MKGVRDTYYAADHARFTVAGMDLAAVPMGDRSRDLGLLLDMLDEFYAHGITPNCEEGLSAAQYEFGTLVEFIYADAAQLKKWGIPHSMMQRMSTSLMATPGIMRKIDNAAWEGLAGFRNDCGFKSCGAGTHYSGDRDTWHEHREAHYGAHNDQIDWNGRTGTVTLEFIPNRLRTDELLRREIERHVESMVREEALQKGWSKEEIKEKSALRKQEILKKWEGEETHVTFHREVMKEGSGTIAAQAGRIGEIICKANFYNFEPELTAKETKLAGGSMRKIFSLTGHDGKKKYISIDFKHGFFEFHDYRGDHLGEYRFNGEFNSEADPSHNLKSVK